MRKQRSLQVRNDVAAERNEHHNLSQTVVDYYWTVAVDSYFDTIFGTQNPQMSFITLLTMLIIEWQE